MHVSCLKLAEIISDETTHFMLNQKTLLNNTDVVPTFPLNTPGVGGQNVSLTDAADCTNCSPCKAKQ